MLRLLLLFQIFYTVYQGHYTFETGIPGLNLPNIVFAVALIFLLANKLRDPVQAPAILKPAILVFYVALVLAFLWAQLRAPGDLLLDVNYLRTALFSPLLYFMYLRSKQDLVNTRWLVIAVMVVAAIAALQAVRQGLDYGIGTFVESRRASGPFGPDYRDANRAGVFYAIFLPMFIALALFLRKQKFWFLAALGGTALLTMAILVTYSRQSYFIALIGLGLLLVRRSLLGAIVLGSLLFGLSVFLPDSVTQRVAETQQEGQHGEEVLDESTASRFEIWTGAAKMFVSNPIGVGLNRFKTEIGNFSSFKNFDAHNFYVLTTAEMGLQGLAALAFVLFAMFKLSAFLRRTVPPDDREAQALAVGFTVMTVCMVLGNMYGSPFLEANVLGLYWILCGLLERYMHLKKLESEGEDSIVERQPTLLDRYPLIARTFPGRRA